MKKLIALLFILMPSLLTGCVPAALVLGATAGGALIYDKRSFKDMHHDQHAHKMAQQRLITDPKLKDSHISLAVFDGVGLLVGQAQSPEAREHAYQLVSNVKNINKIYNEITIAGSITKFQRSNDAWLTTKVRSALLTKRGLQSNNVKVVTEGSVVYLMGTMPREQAELATEAARHVNGVTKVVKVFTYG